MPGHRAPIDADSPAAGSPLVVPFPDVVPSLDGRCWLDLIEQLDDDREARDG